MENNITITSEQLETIKHYQRMLRLNYEKIEGLCSKELDDISYGFELGKINCHLEECFMGMAILTDEIRSKKTK
tara:strand:+ start:7730 stop:7951 length:222 start_codon:yes stop_codon:yes gene_type:complete